MRWPPGTHHFHEYDKVEKMIRFEPVRFYNGPYASASYIAVVGSITKEQATALAKVLYYGDSWLFVEKIKVSIDGTTYDPLTLEFRRGNTSDVWEYAYLPLDDAENRALLNRIVASEETIIRFEGSQYYDDLIVTDRMKADIVAMLGAVDSVNGRP